MTLRSLANDLASGVTTSERLVSEALGQIEDPDGQGAVMFREMRSINALQEARAWDARRASDNACPMLGGVPFSVKDNIAVQGCFRHGASKAMADRPPEADDAPFIAILKSLGLVAVGMTNMSEFAYSGLGTNSHYGTPLSDRKSQRIAGGSSSGGAISVKEGIVPIAIGTDTSGSVRIPAAMCGLAGFRPSQGRYPIEGTIPLAPSFDSVGSIANTTDCLLFLDELITREVGPSDYTVTPNLIVPTELLQDVDSRILQSFEQFTERLITAGIRVTVTDMPELLDIRQCVASAQIVTFEAYQWHRSLIQTAKALYDPRVAMRFDDVSSLCDRCYEQGKHHLATLRRCVDKSLSEVDGILAPTVPIQAPTLMELEDESEYLRLNSASFQNTSVANHLDLPSVCFPTEIVIAVPGSAMLIGKRGQDAKTLALANLLSNFTGV